MNAKKIMGAVLVALLAVTAFAGVAAAADSTLTSQTVFINQKLGSEYNVDWTSAAGTAKPLEDPKQAGVYYFGTAGVYTYKVNESTTITTTVVAPTATITGVAGTGASAYPFIPGTLYSDDAATATFKISSAINTYTIYLAKPNEPLAYLGATANDLANAVKTNPAAGTYTVVLQYKLEDFVNGTTVTEIQTQPLTFTIADAEIGATISASETEVLSSKPVTLTITGQPGVNYTLKFDNNAFEIETDQLSLSLIDKKADIANGQFQFDMSNAGKIEILVTAGKDAGKSETIKLVKTDGNKMQGEVTIKFISGAITDVKTDAPSYFIGADAKVTGITSAGKLSDVTITGNNFEANFDATEIAKWDLKYGTGAQQTFEFVIPTGKLVNEKKDVGVTNKNIDVGPYVITLNATGTKASVALLLTQPFLSIVSAPEVVVQDEEAEFVVNAEAAEDVWFYIFGNNYFKSAEAEDADDGIEGHFAVSLNKTETKGMDEGQYFVVFQHPMYDKEFNVTYTGGNWIKVNGNDVIDLTKRQSANAAEALCVELDAQNIDDIYVKHSFFVVDDAESSYISDIPEEIAKGTTLTVNGVDTANAGKSVTVQMLSTAFAAVPKEAQNLASFAVIVNTVIAEDGTWEVALDTSDLAIDEYNVKVIIDGKEEKKTVTNVVAGSAPDTPDTPDVPDTPDTPDEPTEPETPGFGALAALAGLGAVAVLLLRRE